MTPGSPPNIDASSFQADSAPASGNGQRLAEAASPAGCSDCSETIASRPSERAISTPFSIDVT